MLNIVKNFCKDCMWAKSKEDLPFCNSMQASSESSCSRKQPLFQIDENCMTCQRQKDPDEKCWWCGNT